MDDIEEIRQLKARYFRFVDSHNWLALVDLFAPNAEIDMTGEGASGLRDPSRFVANLERILDGVTSVHHGHMPEIELTSPTQATGIWAMEDKLWWPDGSSMKRLHGYGHYHEIYEKIDGRWLITRMKLTRIRRDVEAG
jgi:SnoaL-like domain